MISCKINKICIINYTLRFKYDHFLISSATYEELIGVWKNPLVVVAVRFNAGSDSVDGVCLRSNRDVLGVPMSFKCSGLTKFAQ